MLKHIVLWKIKENEDKAEACAQIKERLEGLVGKIPEIKKLHVGKNINGGEYDVILISAFEDADALKRYDQNPLHLAVREYIRGVVEKRTAVDFESCCGCGK